MEFLATLARQPLFRLLGAIIVLLAVEADWRIGIAVFVVWFLWAWWGAKSVRKNKGW